MFALVSVVLFAGCAAAAAKAARAAGRPLPFRVASAISVLPLAILLVGPLSGTTFLPLDHCSGLPPWSGAATRPPRNPSLNDVALQFLPWARATRGAWDEGSLPLRNRWNGCGSALAANGGSEAFSLLKLPGLLLPLLRDFEWAAAIRLFLAGSGTWLWLTELGVSAPSAFLGAAAFSLSYTIVPWLLFPISGVVCLWPWILFAVERCRRAAARGGPILLGAVVALALLGGHVESVVSLGFFALLWLASRRAVGDAHAVPGGTVRVAMAAAAAVGMTACFLAPHALAILASNRFAVLQKPFWSSVTSFLPHGPGWRAAFLTAFFPRTYGDGIDSPILPGGLGSPPEMGLGYFGIVGWLLASQVLRPGGRRHRAGIALAVPLVSGLAGAAGQWPFAEIFAAVPGLRWMFPMRLLSWVALAGSALAAFELDRLRADLAKRRSLLPWPLAAAAALGVFALVVFFRFGPRHAVAGGLSSQRVTAIVALGFLGAAAATLLVLGRRRAKAPPVLLAAVLAGLAAAELLVLGARLYALSPTALLFPPTPIGEFLRTRAGPFRVAGVRSLLFPGSNVFAGVEDARTHDPIERRDYVEFLDATCGYPPADYVKFLTNPTAPALDFLAVRYLAAPPGSVSPSAQWRVVYAGPDGVVLENTAVLPRAFAPPHLTTVRARAGRGSWWVRNAFAELGSDPRTLLASLSFGERAVVGAASAGDRTNGPARIDRWREQTNAASFRVRTDAESVLVVTSLVQDGGWTARDERGRIETALVNGPFLGVWVGRGDHAVAVSYRPPGLVAGAAVSLATLAVLVAALARSRRRLSRPAGPAPAARRGSGGPSRASRPSGSRETSESGRAGGRP